MLNHRGRERQPDPSAGGQIHSGPVVGVLHLSPHVRLCCKQHQLSPGGRNDVCSSEPGNLTWLAANVAPNRGHQSSSRPRPPPPCWACIWTSVAGLCREWKNIINTWIRTPPLNQPAPNCDLTPSQDFDFTWNRHDDTSQSGGHISPGDCRGLVSKWVITTAFNPYLSPKADQQGFPLKTDTLTKI